MRHRIEERDIRTRTRAQMQSRKIRQFDLARVDQNQLRAVFADRFLHFQTNNRMCLGCIASSNEQDIRQMNIGDGIGHRARAQCRGQTGHGTGVSEPRAVVDVICADQSARHLLQEIIFLVRALGRDEETD
jgi:hypothetical protein